LTRFLDANRSPPRIKSGAGFRLKTLQYNHRQDFSCKPDPGLTNNLPLFRTPTCSNGMSRVMNGLCRDDISTAKT
jgi:hypothetical protein